MNLRMDESGTIDVKQCVRCGGDHFKKKITEIKPGDFMVQPKDHFGNIADNKFFCENVKEPVFLKLNWPELEDVEQNKSKVELLDLLNKFKKTSSQSLKLWWVYPNGLSRRELIQSSDMSSNWHIDDLGRIVILGFLFDKEDLFLNFDDALKASKSKYPELYEPQSIILPTSVTI